MMANRELEVLECREGIECREGGDVLAGDAGDVQRGKGHRQYRWTSARKTAFLDRLAATCNARASALAAGVSEHAAYRLRRRDAAFAAEWGAALEAGYQLLETHLVGVALAMSGALGQTAGEGTGGAATLAEFEAGFRMLRHCAATRRDVTRGARHWGKSSREETDKEILRKLATLAARRLSA